jgi:hypothetical protein
MLSPTELDGTCALGGTAHEDKHHAHTHARAPAARRNDLVPFVLCLPFFAFETLFPFILLHTTTKLVEIITNNQAASSQPRQAPPRPSTVCQRAPMLTQVRPVRPHTKYRRWRDPNPSQRFRTVTSRRAGSALACRAAARRPLSTGL